MKRKLLLQHQASTSSETEVLQKQKKAEGNTAKSKIVPCICAAVRHIHVKRRASLREASIFLMLSHGTSEPVYTEQHVS
jgi:hypothetical protein